ncbi:DNA-processing protein DprA [Salinibacterium sp. G-O1]|uniref:DNA-processing protein DprA n=1 Tax=Salinibacterium sp. G-O1 TaxID=3046208 RepID=UPI0024BA9211|nr:DNA-processing protein DprA [Salinibacterium sp. G-O1]MDJ0336553.1 DNA-processing protein DprA [Salinibacterium sp. G-O1]
MTDTTTTELQGLEDLTADAIARATLSCLLEPGDTDAGRLVTQLGAADALRAILNTDTDTDDDESNGGGGAGVPEQLRARAQHRFTPGTLAMAYRAAAQFGATLVTPEHPHWPTRMNDLGDAAPFALWVRGDSEILTDTTTTAIVGARAATGYGEHITMDITAGLVARGHTVASGAAYGIDGMAHRAALAAGGRTVAYLAGGVDRFYPSGHDALLTRIVEQGAVVSELPCGAMPTRWRFQARGRLIAANSTAVLVTEAGWRSGSLNTAHHAQALGRGVGAVPGPVTSAASAGCHRLIRDHHATLITCAEEAAEL